MQRNLKVCVIGGGGTLSAALGSAACSSSRRTASRWPLLAAWMRPVRPSCPAHARRQTGRFSRTAFDVGLAWSRGGLPREGPAGSGVRFARAEDGAMRPLLHWLPWRAALSRGCHPPHPHISNGFPSPGGGGGAQRVEKERERSCFLVDTGRHHLLACVDLCPLVQQQPRRLSVSVLRRANQPRTLPLRPACSLASAARVRACGAPPWSARTHYPAGRLEYAPAASARRHPLRR